MRVSASGYCDRKNGSEDSGHTTRLTALRPGSLGLSLLFDRSISRPMIVGGSASAQSECSSTIGWISRMCMSVRCVTGVVARRYSP